MHFRCTTRHYRFSVIFRIHRLHFLNRRQPRTPARLLRQLAQSLPCQSRSSPAHSVRHAASAGPASQSPVSQHILPSGPRTGSGVSLRRVPTSSMTSLPNSQRAYTDFNCLKIFRAGIEWGSRHPPESPSDNIANNPSFLENVRIRP